MIKIMPTFNVGDKVKIVREYKEVGFNWVRSMNCLIGKTVTITEVHMQRGRPWSYSVSGCLFCFMAGSFEKEKKVSKTFNELLHLKLR